MFMMRVSGLGHQTMDPKLENQIKLVDEAFTLGFVDAFYTASSGFDLDPLCDHVENQVRLREEAERQHTAVQHQQAAQHQIALLTAQLAAARMRVICMGHA